MSNLEILSFIFLLASSISLPNCRKIEGDFEVCQRSKPNFDSCLSSAIENGVRLLKSGLELFKIPPIDPFEKKSLTVGAGTGAVHLTQYYKNLVITGFADMKVNQSHLDMDKKTLTFTTIHPKVEQKSDYSINGKLLVLPVQGSGDCRLTLENIVVGHTLQFEEVEKNNQVYFSVKLYKVNLAPTHASYQFNNLFNGNKILGENINRLINEEWYTIFQDVRDNYEKSYAAIFINWARGVFDNIPIKDLLPE